jgi:hypothetical protein
MQEGLLGSRSSLQLSSVKITLQKPGVADPDQAFHLNADPGPLLINLMGICGRWSIDPPWLHCEGTRPYTAVF